MAVTLSFFPVGNGDCSEIVLADGRRLLFDYNHQKASEEAGSREFNLKKHLQDTLRGANRDYYDIVALTHGDNDHICNSTEFFELRYAKKYQGDGRVKIRELWVPAAMILEPATQESRSEEVVIWRQEARFRLIEGKGIRVFSRPDKLKDWLEANGLSVESRSHLISDAGTTVPTFSLANDGVEFFVHSPFIKHVDDYDILRNEASLIFQIRFEINGTRFNYLAIGDSTHEVLSDIVAISKFHSRGHRLDWDLFNIPHHCSYLALGPDKGKAETEPTEHVKELLTHGQRDAYMVCSSKAIGSDQAAYDQNLPPHVQAKNTYQRYLRRVNGRRFLVTMEEPSVLKPQPIVFEITSMGGRLQVAKTGAAAIISAPAPRAG
jgi:hypothetical protein